MSFGHCDDGVIRPKLFYLTEMALVDQLWSLRCRGWTRSRIQYSPTGPFSLIAQLSSAHKFFQWAIQISFLLHILRFLFFFPNLKMLNLFEFYLKAWGILMPNTLQRSPLFVVAPIYVVKPKK